LSDSTLGPCPPAVALYDSAHDSEADARSSEILGSVQPLEHLKSLLAYCMSKPAPLSCTRIVVIPASPLKLSITTWFGRFAGILYGVGEQVHQHLVKQRKIAFDLR